MNKISKIRQLSFSFFNKQSKNVSGIKNDVMTRVNLIVNKELKQSSQNINNKIEDLEKNSFSIKDKIKRNIKNFTSKISSTKKGSTNFSDSSYLADIHQQVQASMKQPNSWEEVSEKWETLTDKHSLFKAAEGLKNGEGRKLQLSKEADVPEGYFILYKNKQGEVKGCFFPHSES